MKQVGIVTAKQFGYVYIDGIPYSPKKVTRFMSKGLGIKVQDTVIFDFELTNNEKVLNYLKNALYADGSELAMVKEFVRATELAKKDLISDELSDEIKSQLAKEGIIITNDGVVVNAPVVEVVDEPVEEPPVTSIEPEVLKVLNHEQRRTLSIMLQSQIKNAVEIYLPETTVDLEKVKALALNMTEWIDGNSTQILKSARDYIAPKEVKE